jgi:peptidoglycan hydrolase-like protein with peptidoglycan-binding domain
MNFQDLFNKIKAIDEGTMVAPAPALAVASGDEVLTGECGGDMPGDIMRPPTPKQSDSVTMNVSLNGSGAGGIRDLMDVLKDIQNGPAHDDSIGDAPEIALAFGEEQVDGRFQDATTSPEQQIGGVEMVTPTGNDIHSNNGDHRTRQAGLPHAQMPVQEQLVSKLQAHYESIKGAGIEEGVFDTIKQGAQSAVQGVKNAANTVANTTLGDIGNAATQGVQKAGQAVANTTLGDIGNAALKYNPVALAGRGINAAAQGVVDVNKAAYGAVGDAAKAVGQKVANAIAPAAQAAPVRAPVKPMSGFEDPPVATAPAIPKTPQEIMAFQKSKGLTPDGIMGPKTQAALKASAPAAAPAAAPASFGFESVEMTDIRRLAGL